jgi:hypothetical protein
MLQNNNQSMATVVETSLVEETINLIHDGEALQKWNDRISELGLEGQKEVLVVKDKSPIPFMWMNDAIIATFETLCPTKVLVEKYNKTPIPLEILDLVALSKNEGYFYKMEIWYNEKEKDPVCIGFAKDETKKEADSWSVNYYAKKYLIGRWADVKASLDTLTARAREIFIVNTKAIMEQYIRDAQRKIEDVETLANNMFGGAMPKTDGLPF